MGLPAYQPEFDSIECGGCGIVFYVPTKWKSYRVSNNGSYHCPNGCSRVWTGENDTQKAARLARELEAAKSAQRFAESRLQDTQARHQRELKRIHRRANAGVCPHCQRTVSQMARHIKTKHPETC